MDISVVFHQVLLLFIPIAAGFVIRKRGIVDGSFTKMLSDFIFVFLLPCLVLDSMRFDFSLEVLINSGLLALVACGVLIVLWGMGFLISKRLGKTFDVQAVIEFSITCSNFTFMGLPVIASLFGQEGVFYASVHNIPYFIFSNSIAIFLINRKNQRVNLARLLLNPPTIAVAAGVLLFLFSIRLPSVLEDSIAMFAGCAPAMSMVLVGLVLAGSDLSKMFVDVRIYVVSLIRLVAAPVAAFFILRAFGLRELLLYVPVVILAMPVAAQIILLSERYEKDSGFAAQTVAVSTLLSVATIPAVVWFINWMKA